MIHPIDEQEIEVRIIPKLVPSLDWCNLDLGKGDTLVLKIDSNTWNIDEAQQFFQLFESIFPDNKIIAIFDGIEIGVIHQHE